MVRGRACVFAGYREMVARGREGRTNKKTEKKVLLKTKKKKSVIAHDTLTFPSPPIQTRTAKSGKGSSIICGCSRSEKREREGGVVGCGVRATPRAHERFTHYAELEGWVAWECFVACLDLTLLVAGRTSKPIWCRGGTKGPYSGRGERGQTKLRYIDI